MSSDEGFRCAKCGFLITAEVMNETLAEESGRIVFSCPCCNEGYMLVMGLSESKENLN